MSFRKLYLFYCGVCVIIGLLLILDYFLPKEKQITYVLDLFTEYSRPIKPSQFSTSRTNYFIKIEDKTLSVDGLDYSNTFIGDTLIIYKTFILKRIIKYNLKYGISKIPDSSIYNLFPFIQILLLLPGLSLIFKKGTPVAEFIMPFSLLVPIFILIFELL